MTEQEILAYARGIVDAVIFFEEKFGELTEELEITYKLKLAGDKVILEMEYNSDYRLIENRVDGYLESVDKDYIRRKTSDFFYYKKVNEAYDRLSGVLEEINTEFYANTENKE